MALMTIGGRTGFAVSADDTAVALVTRAGCGVSALVEGSSGAALRLRPHKSSAVHKVLLRIIFIRMAALAGSVLKVLPLNSGTCHSALRTNRFASHRGKKASLF